MAGSLKIWIDAARPKTLWAGFAPVVIGSALAHAEGAFHAGVALVALAVAISVQIATNFCNDYADFKKGADTAERVGPVRATQAGLVTPRAMFIATILAFALCAAFAAVLYLRAGRPVLWIAIASILSGILYTAGPKPLAYLGLGDIFVLVFFGPVAVAGTHYMQALRYSEAAVVAGLAPGLLSVAILVVNNVRDVETDVKAGKRTLAVRFGKPFARLEYVFCLAGAALVPPLLVLGYGGSRWCLLGCLFLIPGLKAVRGLYRETGRALNPYLGFTAKLLLGYSILFSIGWVIR